MHDEAEKSNEEQKAAFSVIYNQYWESLYKYVIRILPDEEEVADVVQETFLALWEIRHQLPEIKSVKSYLFIMARNKAFKRLQRLLRRQDVMDRFTAHFSDTDEIAEQLLFAKSLSSLIEQEISKLPERMRTIFIMSRKQHMPYKEIAKKLQISDLTVKKQINNSLKQLRLKIGEEHFLLFLFLLADRFLLL